MATIAFDSYDARPAKAPISAHPAFPGIVALWFAALLGLGSLVLPPILLERALTATGLASLVPALAPPLGFTARALLALVAALLGAGLGVAIARRVARGHMPEPENRVVKLTKRPISVHEELGGEGVINGRGLPINRRRALAISEDERPSDFLYMAPLPGEDPYAHEPSPDPAPDAAPDLADAPAPQEEPLELCEIAEGAAEALDFAAPDTADDVAEEDDRMTDKQEFQPVSPFETFDGGALPAAAVDELDARKNGAGPRGVEPLPFSAPSLARRAPRQSLEVTMALPDRETSSRQEFVPAAEPVAYEPEPAPEPEPEAELFRGDWETAPTEALGLVQLVQRLGKTIEKRREWVAACAAAVPSASAPSPLNGVEAAPAEEAVQAMAAFFGSSAAPADPEPTPVEPEPGEYSQVEEEEPAPMPRPAFLRGIASEQDEDEHEDDDVPNFTLPLGQAGAPSAAFTGPDDALEEDQAGEAGDEGGYSSLLAMRNPFDAPTEAEFVRIEEPEPDADDPEPAVVFPALAAPDAPDDLEEAPPARRFDPPGKAAPSFGASPAADNTDAALRAALATLQRMGGAA